MHYRRLACLLLGAWLAGSLFMTMVATQNFRAVDRLLESPSPRAAKQIQALGKAETRLFLRYQVAEQNRWYFETWERVQLGLGVLLLLAFVLGAEARPSMLALSAIMLAAVAAQHWLMTPEIVRLGRVMDFLPATKVSAARARFWNFHTAYSSTEVVKLVLGLLMTVRLLARRRRRTHEVSNDLDAVDDADDGHVNW